MITQVSNVCLAFTHLGWLFHSARILHLNFCLPDIYFTQKMQSSTDKNHLSLTFITKKWWTTLENANNVFPPLKNIT